MLEEEYCFNKYSPKHTNECPAKTPRNIMVTNKALQSDAASPKPGPPSPLCDLGQITPLLGASSPLSQHGDDDNSDLTGWFESDKRQLCWDTHLQADKGEGDALPLEVFQELPEPQHDRVVDAADMAALQDRTAWR